MLIEDIQAMIPELKPVDPGLDHAEESARREAGRKVWLALRAWTAAWKFARRSRGEPLRAPEKLHAAVCAVITTLFARRLYVRPDAQLALHELHDVLETRYMDPAFALPAVQVRAAVVALASQFTRNVAELELATLTEEERAAWSAAVDAVNAAWGMMVGKA